MLKWWKTRTTTREIAKLARDAAHRANERVSLVHRGLGDHVADLPSSQVVTFAPIDDATPWAAPTRAHQYDAGIDLRASKGVVLQPSASAVVPTGTTVRIPKGYYGMVAVRSGIGFKGIGLLNGVGIIDHGYEGEIKLALANFGSEEFRAEPGERLAQIIIQPCVNGPISFIAQSEPLTPVSERGEGGFGSTGA